jgi:methionyl-tRNA synthetase
MALADRANQYIDEKKPWVIAKEDGKEHDCMDAGGRAKQEARAEELQDICSMGINLFRLLIGYLRPVLPATTELAEEFLQIEPLTWEQLATPLLDHEIAKFKPLMTRVESQHIEAMVEASREDLSDSKDG